MTNKDYITIKMRLSQKDHEKVERLARKRGYDNTDAYLRSLIVSDAVAHDEDLDLEDDPVAGFLQGWHEVMTGQTRPISELWDALNEDQD